MTASPEEKILSGLKRIRFCRIAFLAVAGAYIPVVAVMYFLALPPPVILSTGAVLMTAGILIEIVIGFSRCPACGAHFHVKGMTGNLLTRSCLNCGIGLSSTAPPAVE